jgi:hypothetical protein
MKKIDWTIPAEILGVGFVAVGLALISIPLALITVGAFLVWITEKN